MFQDVGIKIMIIMFKRTKAAWELKANPTLKVSQWGSALKLMSYHGVTKPLHSSRAAAMVPVHAITHYFEVIFFGGSTIQKFLNTSPLSKNKH